MVPLNAMYRNPSARSKTQMSRRKRNMGPRIAGTMTFNLHADHVALKAILLKAVAVPNGENRL